MAKKEITDFGSKIGGARKDVWVKRGLCVEDIKDMTASEKEKYIKRDYIWPKPDIPGRIRERFFPLYRLLAQRNAENSNPKKE